VEAVVDAIAMHAIADAKAIEFRIFVLKELLEHMDFRWPSMSLEERTLFEKFVNRVVSDILGDTHRPMLLFLVVNVLSFVASKLAEAFGAKEESHDR
jgi:hypothetical protein